MSDDQVFRRKLEEAPVPETPTAPKEMVNDDITGATKAFEESDEPRERVNALENWEMRNGIKYGIELFQIKDVMSEFTVKMDFSVVDKYIRDEIVKNGYDPSPQKWQEILEGLENDLGTGDLDAFERLKKLSSYVKILRKYSDISEKKKAFLKKYESRNI